MKTIRLLLLASTLAFAWQATGSAAVIFKDDFTGVTSATLNDAGWYFYQRSAAGKPWSIGTSTDSPLSGNVLTNPGNQANNTTSFKSFDPVTLGKIGERVIIRFDDGVDANFGLTVGFTQNPLTSNQFVDPPAAAAPVSDYSYAITLSASSTAGQGTLGFRRNNVDTSKTAKRPGIVFGGGVAHSHEFILERTDTGLLLMATIDGVAVTPEPVLYSDYTFNYISFGGSGKFDNVEVLFVPEASSTLLMGAGLFVLGLPLWLKRRRLARA